MSRVSLPHLLQILISLKLSTSLKIFAIFCSKDFQQSDQDAFIISEERFDSDRSLLLTCFV